LSASPTLSAGWRLSASVLLLLNCCSRPLFTSQAEIVGCASYYGKEFHGKRTASGEVYNMYALTAAHRTLPFGTLVRVTNWKNGKSVVVKINDRGPFVEGRTIDLSYAAARRIGLMATGRVRLTILR